jgi:hypothetical protein
MTDLRAELAAAIWHEYTVEANGRFYDESDSECVADALMPIVSAAIARAKAEAWDEGYAAGEEGTKTWFEPQGNPYRVIDPPVYPDAGHYPEPPYRAAAVAADPEPTSAALIRHGIPWIDDCPKCGCGHGVDSNACGFGTSPPAATAAPALDGPE